MVEVNNSAKDQSKHAKRELQHLLAPEAVLRRMATHLGQIAIFQSRACK